MARVVVNVPRAAFVIIWPVKDAKTDGSLIAVLWCCKRMIALAALAATYPTFSTIALGSSYKLRPA